MALWSFMDGKVFWKIDELVVSVLYQKEKGGGKGCIVYFLSNNSKHS